MLRVDATRKIMGLFLSCLQARIPGEARASAAVGTDIVAVRLPESTHLNLRKLSGAMTTPQVRDSLKYTRICKYYGLNKCKLGKDCNFAHSELELRGQPDLVQTRLCFQYSSKGRCKNGENCKFAHGRSQLRSLPQARSRTDEMQPMKVKLGNVGLPVVTSLGASPQKIAPISFRPPPGLPVPPGLKGIETECSTAFPSRAGSEPSEPGSPRSL